MRNVHTLLVVFLLAGAAVSLAPSPSNKNRRDTTPSQWNKDRRDTIPSQWNKDRRDATPSQWNKDRRDTTPSQYSKKRREVDQLVLTNKDELNCGVGLTSCPISPLDSRHECVNMKEDLENCGACGNICGKGKGARTSSCVSGKCAVSSCRPGYSLNDGICERNYLN